MTKLRPLAVAIIAAASLSVANAQDTEPQVERHELMEEIGSNMKTMGDMVKGEQPYDAAKVEAALGTIGDNVQKFVTLFPEGSETGHDTRALPAIWENPSEFEERADALVEAVNAAQEVAPDGVEAFAPAFLEVGQTCRGCHTDFRAEKS